VKEEEEKDDEEDDDGREDNEGDELRGLSTFSSFTPPLP
jgi:hypothetical protein